MGNADKNSFPVSTPIPLLYIYPEENPIQSGYESCPEFDPYPYNIIKSVSANLQNMVGRWKLQCCQVFPEFKTHSCHYVTPTY